MAMAVSAIFTSINVCEEGEIAAYDGDFHAINLQALADQSSKVRVGAYGSYMRKLWIILGKLVYLFDHFQDAFLCIFCMKRGQLDASKEEFLYLHGLVLSHFLVDYLLDFCCYFLVVEVAVILFQN